MIAEGLVSIVVKFIDAFGVVFDILLLLVGFDEDVGIEYLSGN